MGVVVQYSGKWPHNPLRAHPFSFWLQICGNHEIVVIFKNGCVPTLSCFGDARGHLYTTVKIDFSQASSQQILFVCNVLDELKRNGAP